LTCFPQFAVPSPAEISRIAFIKQRILATLTPEEAAEWRSAVAQAEEHGAFFVATPYHCAVGTKPS
jgi:hypothetical protein